MFSGLPTIVYSDLNCPFCHALNEITEPIDDGTILWRGVEHMPELSSDGDASAAALTVLAEELELLRSRRVDVRIAVPPLRPSSRAGVLAIAAAQRIDPDAARRLRTALFRALWWDGQNIGDVAVVDAVAKGVGLDPTRLRPHRALLNEVASWTQAWLDLGERRIPTMRSVTGSELLGLPTRGDAERFLLAGVSGANERLSCLRDEEVQSEPGGGCAVPAAADPAEHLSAQLARALSALPRLRMMVELVPEMVILHDRAGIILECNGRLAATLGRAPRDYVGLPLSAIDIELTGGRPPWGTMGEGQGSTFERCFIDVDGQEVPVEVTVRAFELGPRGAIILTARDLRAERARLGAAQEAARRRQEHVAHMCHEIRTPMNAIVGLSELLAAQQLDATSARYAGIIAESARSLVSIVDEVLNAARSEARQEGPLRETFSPVEVVEEVARVVSVDAHARGLAVHVIAGPDVPSWAVGDRGRYRQIAANLASNAVKYTQDGEVVLELSARAEAGSWRLTLTVTDTGRGMSPAELQRVFDPYYRAQDSAGAPKGTGLGLSLARQFARELGGDITASSELGTGSSFRCTVRLEQPPEVTSLAAGLKGVRVAIDASGELRRSLEARVRGLGGKVVDTGEPSELYLTDARDGRSPSSAPPGRTISVRPIGGREEATGESLYVPLRGSELLGLVDAAAHGVDQQTAMSTQAAVLLVDDNPTNRTVGAAVFTHVGARVTLCDSGAACLDALARERFDVILLDCQMPEMDGFEVAGAVRERGIVDRRGQPITIVALTASALPGDREKSLAAGMDHHVTKPVTLDEATKVLAGLGADRAGAGHAGNPSYG